MNALPQIYKDAVKIIKQAILESQYRSAKKISGEQLKKELPGLHGFSAESIKKMRQFYEFWSQFINRSPSATEINRDDFLGSGLRAVVPNSMPSGNHQPFHKLLLKRTL